MFQRPLTLALTFVAALFVPGRSSSQVPVPQVPAGARLWLEADRGLVLVNGRVARWMDQSGNQNDAVQNNPTNRPDTLVRSSDGKPSVRFTFENSMVCPPIYPVNHDYTVSVVVRILDTTTINNLVSGYNHALYLPNERNPCVMHGSFFHQEYSTIPIWALGYSVVTLLYSEDDQQAKLYVNGEFADSSFVGSNSDSALLIGSYSGGYFLQGELHEVILYDREFSELDRATLDAGLLQKYGIVHAHPNPKPDSTFTAIPAQLQLYARGADDSATVPISGRVYRPGFDSISAIVLKNGTSVAEYTQKLTYTDGSAPFDFTPRIHAELSEYRFEVHLRRPSFDSIVATRDSITCGDAFLIDGQSNTIYGYDTERYRSEFCRTIGFNFSQNIRDTLWALGLAHRWGEWNSVGAWGQRIARNIIDQEHIPVFCINGAVGATNIGQHLRLDSNKYSLRSIYGDMLYRATKSGLLPAFRAIFWEQGEANYADGYYAQFLQLYQAWHEDYPNLQKIYILQNRPNFCYWGNIDMRDVQRSSGDLLHGVEPIAKAALPYYDGCHLTDPGFEYLGDRLFLSLARDFYHSTDTENLRSPNAIYAYYLNPEHSKVAILFSPRGVRLHATNDTTVGGVFATLKDYLYPNDPNTRVQSISFDRDTLFVNFDGPSSSTSIGYLPDQHYNGNDTLVYGGPWIENDRGYGALLWHVLPIANTPMAVNASNPTSFGLRLYPNPASTLIGIEWPESMGGVYVRILDERGALVRSTKVTETNGRLSIDLSGLASGIYGLALTDSKKTVASKFVIE